MGWSLFKSKAFLDPEDEAWHLEAWAWLLRNWGGAEDLRRSPLVTPTPEYFPSSKAVGHARAAHFFDLIKRHAKMEGWDCRLEPQPEKPNPQVSRFVILQPASGSNPSGTFGATSEGVLITYDPAVVKTPTILVATLAHELAHYRLAYVREDPPGGREMEEYATDLATVYLGFGFFGANSAFNFRQHQSVSSQGWSWSRQGYLSERDWAFALAVFFRLTGRNAVEAKEWLKPHLYSDFQKALKRLDAEPSLLDPLRSIPGVETPSEPVIDVEPDSQSA